MSASNDAVGRVKSPEPICCFVMQGGNAAQTNTEIVSH